MRPLFWFYAAVAVVFFTALLISGAAHHPGLLVLALVGTWGALMFKDDQV